MLLTLKKGTYNTSNLVANAALNTKAKEIEREITITTAFVTTAVPYKKVTELKIKYQMLVRSFK